MEPSSSLDSLKLRIDTSSVQETFELGVALGKLLSPGTVLALVGDLAAGKTLLAKGLAVGVGVADEKYVTSPAYDLVHEYQGRLPVYHLDFYRLDELSPSDQMWVDEYISGDGITLIEWADKFPMVLPNDHVRIELQIILDHDTGRRISVEGLGQCTSIVAAIKGLRSSE